MIAEAGRLTLRVAALLAALVLMAALAGTTSPARADVRATASWHVELAPREWARLPATRTTGSMRDVLAIRRGAIRRGRVLAIRRGHVLPIRRGRVLALPAHGGNRPPWPMLRIIDAVGRP